MIDTFDWKIHGIPCLIRVNGLKRNKAEYESDGVMSSPATLELDWKVLDRKGYVANWLYMKLLPREIDEIEDRIMECYR